MASVDECLREASDCVRHAEQCSEESEQAIFMLMAKSWMRLAVQVDEVRGSPSLAADGEEHLDETADMGSLEGSGSVVPDAPDVSEGAAADERTDRRA